LANTHLPKEASEAVYFDVTGNCSPDSLPVGSINRARQRGEVVSRKARMPVKGEAYKAIGSSS
jgi:hypothetical protein